MRETLNKEAYECLLDIAIDWGFEIREDYHGRFSRTSPICVVAEQQDINAFVGNISMDDFSDESLEAKCKLLLLKAFTCPLDSMGKSATIYEIDAVKQSEE